MVTSCKDKVVRIIDPRSNVPIILSSDSHQSIKDSRVVWLGDQQRILTTGNKIGFQFVYVFLWNLFQFYGYYFG